MLEDVDALREPSRPPRARRRRCRACASSDAARPATSDGDRRSPSRSTRSSPSATPSSTRRRSATRYQSFITPASVYDYDMATRRANAPEADARCSAATTRRATAPSGVDADGAGRHEGPDLARLPEGPRRATARRRCCLTAYGSYGDSPTPTFSLQPLQPARSRRRLRHRAHPRRRRARQALARPGPHDDEEEHLHRLHRRAPST